MDVKINSTDGRDQYLEYNTLGGVLDFYFLAGGATPVDVARQYAEVVGLPAMMPYWGFGFNNVSFLDFRILYSWFEVYSTLDTQDRRNA